VWGGSGVSGEGEERVGVVSRSHVGRGAFYRADEGELGPRGVVAREETVRLYGF
jgi:hypothetical protein